MSKKGDKEGKEASASKFILPNERSDSLIKKSQEDIEKILAKAQPNIDQNKKKLSDILNDVKPKERAQKSV